MVNLPVGLLGLLLTVRYVGATARKKRDRIDLLGPLASVAALGGFTYAIVEGAPRGWSSSAVLAGVGVALIGMAVLIVAETNGADPMLPRGLFTLPGFSAGTAVGFLLNFGFYGQLFLLSLYFQGERGLSPVATGLALLPETGVALIANLVSGRMTARIGPRWPLTLGLALSGAGLLALAPATGSTAYLVLAATLVVVGFGAALAVPAVTVSILELAPGEQAGISAGVLNTSRQMSGVLGVALLGALASGVDSALPGLHQALVVAGCGLLLATGIALCSDSSSSSPVVTSR